MDQFLNKKFKMVKSENFEEYMKKLGKKFSKKIK